MYSIILIYLLSTNKYISTVPLCSVGLWTPVQRVHVCVMTVDFKRSLLFVAESANSGLMPDQLQYVGQ